MNCPNCGNEINENQKFCPMCGTKLEMFKEKVEENNEIEINDTEIEQVQSHELNPFMKKVAIVIVSIVVLAGIACGTMRYQQYKKDIAPYEITTSFGGHEVDIKATYDAHHKDANLSMLHKGTIIEQWQIDCINAWQDTLSYELKDNSNQYTFSFLNTETTLSKPLILNFKIDNIKTSKDFMKFKENFDGSSLYRDMPKLLNEDTKVRLEGKKIWLKWKREEDARVEAERKQKEWQDNVLSNCVYKTSDGVCFTTQLFEAERLKVVNIDENYYDRWLTAKDACECRGYKLPSDDDLRSLFQDILGVKIEKGINIKSYKHRSTTNIPTNYDILKRIAPDGFNKYSSGTYKWRNIYLWEDESFDDKSAYVRDFDNDFGSDVTSQKTREKRDYDRGTEQVICVYDPNGKPHKSLIHKLKEEEKHVKQELEKKKQQTEQASEQAVKDALF